MRSAAVFGQDHVSGENYMGPPTQVSWVPEPEQATSILGREDS